MLKEGYQPNKGKLDILNPPQGGSGIMGNKLYLGKYKRLNIKKDDVIILNLEQEIPTEGIKHMIKLMKQTFPDNKAIVLCKGVKLSVIRKKYKL